MVKSTINQGACFRQTSEMFIREMDTLCEYRLRLLSLRQSKFMAWQIILTDQVRKMFSKLTPFLLHF